jgi:glycosyltransferase involved in cell wall biosynthesis
MPALRATVKLLIISHTPHYLKDDHFVGWGPTVRELDYLTEIFERVIHLAPLHREVGPASALRYQSTRLEFRPLPPAGGGRLRDKLAILIRTPQYLGAILKALREVDAVHVRCPANISLLAIMLLACVPRPRLRWVKYAGNWRPTTREAWSYAFQRWWLTKNLHRGVVTVNGHWTDQPRHVRSFLNPCLTEQELVEAERVAAGKELSTPLRLLYAGRLETAKGVGRAIEVLHQLRQRGIAATFDIVGDGAERSAFESLVAARELTEVVTFHGWLARTLLNGLFARAHFLIFPAASSEGWPKVLSEGMAHGVVPVASTVSSIPQFLDSFQTGRTCAPDDVTGFVNALAWYVQHPYLWKEESVKGVQAAQLFSYRNYLQAVRTIFDLSDARPPKGYLDNGFVAERY